MNNEELLKKIETLVLDTEKRLTKKIGEVDAKVDRVEKNFTQKIDIVDAKVDRVEKNLTQKIDTVDMKVEIVNTRVAKLEQKTDTEIKKLIMKIDQSIEENAHFFQEATIIFDQIRNELLHKIKKLEEFVGFPSSSKN